MLSEFKKFIMRGNVLDLAVGVIIGAAFGKIVTSLVNDVLMPVVGLATGKVEWDTKVPQLPLGAATVSNDLVFTTLYNGVLIALNRSTGAIVYRRRLPTSTNSPIAVAASTVIVPAGGPVTSVRGGGGGRFAAGSASGGSGAAGVAGSGHRAGG